MNKEDILKAMRQARKAKGLTIIEAGKMIGVKTVTLGSWERGDRAITLDNLIKVAEGYNLSLAELLGLVSISKASLIEAHKRAIAELED